jgi:hypothetical protein
MPIIYFFLFLVTSILYYMSVVMSRDGTHSAEERSQPRTKRRRLPQPQPRSTSASGSDQDGRELSFPLDGDVSGAQLPANYAPYSIFHAFDNYLGICYYPLA